jgi:hypothetical protein
MKTKSLVSNPVLVVLPAVPLRVWLAGARRLDRFNVAVWRSHRSHLSERSAPERDGILSCTYVCLGALGVVLKVYLRRDARVRRGDADIAL